MRALRTLKPLSGKKVEPGKGTPKCISPSGHHGKLQKKFGFEEICTICWKTVKPEAGTARLMKNLPYVRPKTGENQEEKTT